MACHGIRPGTQPRRRDSALLRGKLAYLAPEVAQRQPGGRESDMFSLGATLFAAVEGRSPYPSADHPASLLSHAAAGNVDEPRRAGPLAPALTRLLLPDPKQRPDAVEATTLLKEISPPDPQIMARIRIWQATAHAKADMRRWLRRRWAVVGVGVAAVAALAVAWFLFGGSRLETSDLPHAVVGDARTAVLPPGSLGHVDACELDASALGDVPGVDALHPAAGFGNWSCHWNSTISGGTDLYFDRNRALTALDGQPVALTGLQSFQTPGFDSPDDCVVRTIYRTYQNFTGHPTVELLIVKVIGSQPMPSRCATARALTIAAVAKLPR